MYFKLYVIIIIVVKIIEVTSMDCIKGIFKIFFILIAITTVAIGAGVAVLAFVFKKDFEELEQKTKQIVSEIEANN